jgi:hypothetical protein
MWRDEEDLVSEKKMSRSFARSKLLRQLPVPLFYLFDAMRIMRLQQRNAGHTKRTMAKLKVEKHLLPGTSPSRMMNRSPRILNTPGHRALVHDLRMTFECDF